MTGSLVAVRAGACLRRVREIPRPQVVEVGVFTGNVSVRLLAGHPGLFLYMVDSWKAGREQPAAYRATHDQHAHMTAAQQESFYRSARSNTAPYAARREILMADSVVAASRFAQGTIDLVFLDADHSVEGCKADLLAWWPIVRRGGYLGGHDWEGFVYYGDPHPPTGERRRSYFGVTQAVRDVFGDWPIELDGDSTWWIRKPFPEGGA